LCVAQRTASSSSLLPLPCRNLSTDGSYSTTTRKAQRDQEEGYSSDEAETAAHQNITPGCNELG
jgi:hypothetical protein